MESVQYVLLNIQEKFCIIREGVTAILCEMYFGPGQATTRPGVRLIGLIIMIDWAPVNITYLSPPPPQ